MFLFTWYSYLSVWVPLRISGLRLTPSMIRSLGSGIPARSNRVLKISMRLPSWCETWNENTWDYRAGARSGMRQFGSDYFAQLLACEAVLWEFLVTACAYLDIFLFSPKIIKHKAWITRLIKFRIRDSIYVRSTIILMLNLQCRDTYLGTKGCTFLQQVTGPPGYCGFSHPSLCIHTCPGLI